MENHEFTVIKASGEKAPFEPVKLKKSLMRAGADQELADEITSKIVREMHDFMRTKEIYRKAFKYLKKAEKGLAARYSLKSAILDIGPAGYPFEGFFARLLNYDGYQTQTNLILKGKCISHEVDVMADRNDQRVFVECKYHTDAGRKSDVKTSLYFHSRFRDLENASAGNGWNTEGWLVTDNRFSQVAVDYGKCMGISLISWDQPKRKGLKEMIEDAGLHPVTCLTSITRAEKQQFIQKGILLCRELVADGEVLGAIIDSPARQKTILNEASVLCKTS